MSRIPRFVVPGVPHFITQRGNRREKVFFIDEDYALYRDLLTDQCRREDVVVSVYCLLPDHVHFVLAPATEDALSRALGETHRRYSAVINARSRVTGHLFHARFSSAAIDESHFLEAARHVSLNPVRVGLVRRAEDWPWSSVRGYLAGEADASGADALVTTAPLVERLGGESFAAWLARPSCQGAIRALRAAETIGRPVGSPDFLDSIAAATGRDPRPGRRGPKPATGRPPAAPAAIPRGDPQ